MSRRSLGFWVALAAVVIVVGYFTSSRRTESGQPLDPDSTDGLGTRALIQLIERFDGQVTRGMPTEDSTAALLLADQLSAEQRGDLETWVDEGGTVVVTDPGSPLTPALAFPMVERRDTLSSGSCTVDSLDGLVLEAGSFLLYSEADASMSCFGDADGSYLHVVERGAGRIVSIGGGLAVTNQYLDEGDNAVLAVELLLSAPEPSSVAVLFEPIVTPGSRTLADLIPSSVRWGTVQLLVAVAILIGWKARRFGRPVDEAQPVKLPGSLLVRASGELRRRSGGFAAADQVVRRHHENGLRRRLKAPTDLAMADLLDAAQAAGGAERSVIERSLVAPQATTGPELVGLLRAIDTVRLAFDEAEDVPIASPDDPGHDLEPRSAGERM